MPARPRLLNPPATTAAPGPPYAWGCLVKNSYHFTYLYGASHTCRQIAAQLEPGQFIRRGTCETLDEARAAAEAAAAELRRLYAGFGSARVVAAKALFDGGPSLDELTSLF